jgi:cytochrome c oxidase subunit 2
MIEPAGPQAAHIHDLWQLALWLCAAVFVLVLAALGIAVARGRRRQREATATDAAPSDDDRAAAAIAVAVALSGVGLAVLFVASLRTDRALADLPLVDGLHIELTGHQWWWEARYDDPDPSRVFTTANELHLPLGRPVILTLGSADVIHSFWVPELAGKKDLIPDARRRSRCARTRPARSRGPCAEFCGWQHAKMTLAVVVEAPDAYERWAERQRASAPEPADALAARGRQSPRDDDLRDVPHGRRDARAGPHGARPHARREPHHARRGRAPEHAAAPRRLDRGRARVEAGRPDAAAAAASRRPARIARVRGYAEMNAWIDRPGLVGALSTVDHKRIGVRFVVTAFAFFVLAGCWRA